MEEIKERSRSRSKHRRGSRGRAGSFPRLPERQEGELPPMTGPVNEGISGSAVLNIGRPTSPNHKPPVPLLTAGLPSRRPSHRGLRRRCGTGTKVFRSCCAAGALDWLDGKAQDWRRRFLFGLRACPLSGAPTMVMGGH
ncbi:hypothetical protein MRX96_016755 [Rhipicephalus microplus]